MGWRTGVVGNHEDLKFLARIFDDDPRIVKEESDFFLEWSEFDSTDDPDEVKRMARDALQLIVGISELDHGLFEGVRIGGVFKSNNGTSVFEKGGPVRSHATPEMREALGLEEPEIYDENEAVQFALSDEAVRDLLLYWERSDSWHNLYKILEFIEGDISEDDLEDTGWISKEDYKNFRRTANHKKIIGRDARHGTSKHRSGPTKAISHEDARNLVCNVSIEWLKRKRHDT